MNEESELESFCSSCKSILQCASSIGEPYNSNEEIYQLTEENNRKTSIKNYENNLDIIDTTHEDIGHLKSYVHKQGEVDEEIIEKLMFYTNKKLKCIDLINEPDLFPSDTYKNIAHKITCVESGNNDFKNKTNSSKIIQAQSTKQKNNNKTMKAKDVIRDTIESSRMINNNSPNTAQNILEYRKDILKTARIVLELSTYIDNMRKLILHKLNKRQSEFSFNNQNNGIKTITNQDLSTHFYNPSCTKRKK
ncbi:uncharacterized protein LOC143260579 [Megalopta genalis]|uniref:uncharacterized protein LOC143260579 n=1 Tax=Megalopta genalis TaxID=115081 RepID=UPI003FD074DC